MLDRPLKRILAVDDDPDVLELAALALGKVGGYTVRTCGSGREAIDQCLSFEPDLILLDVMMPGVDGFGTLKALREIAATADTPVVFMTAMVQRQDLDHYEELGCLGVIPKPVDLVSLPETLEGLWGRRRVQLAEVHMKEFEALRRTYIRGLSERIGAMRAAAAVLAAEGWDRSAVESLYHQAHRMAGTSGLYQLSALSRSAGALEGIIKRLLNAQTWPPPSRPVELTTLVKAVERTVRKEVRQVGRARANAQA